MSADETYIFQQLTADEQAIHAANMARLTELLPGWVERDTAIEALVSRALAAEQAVVVDIASDVLATLLAEVGRVAGLARELPAPAAGRITVTTDGLGTYVLPAGATMRAYLPDQTPVDFFTIADASIAAGVTTADVPVEAVLDQEVTNLGPSPLDVDQAYQWLEAASLVELTSIGADGEDDDQYLDRVSSRLQLLADRPILPDDFRRLALDVPGVGRALALDLVDATDPENPVEGVERCVTVVVTGPGGTEPSSALLEAVRADLAVRREVSFKVFVVAPTYVPLEVEVTVAVWPEYALGVEDRVAEVLETWLQPSTFGSRNFLTDGGPWSEQSTVRVGEVVSVADTAIGVDYVDPTLVLVNGSNSDKVLTGLAPLPDPAATTVVVNVVERQP